jgi:SUMO ligase MMS21 Smc5/6 complex component
MTPFQECHSTTVTSCFHIFETDAIQTWLRGHTTCPVCKQAVGTHVVV